MNVILIFSQNFCLILDQNQTFSIYYCCRILDREIQLAKMMTQVGLTSFLITFFLFKGTILDYECKILRNMGLSRSDNVSFYYIRNIHK